MNTMPSLYTISGDLLALLSAIEANEGEITPDIEQALAITEDQFAAKATDYGLAILNLEAMAKAAKAEKERLAGLQKFYENVSNRLRSALCGAMDVLDHPKVESPSVRLFLRHTTATEVDDVTKLPDEFPLPPQEYELVGRPSRRPSRRVGRCPVPTWWRMFHSKSSTP